MDAAIIADLMMGGEGKPEVEELNELHLSAVSEAMNQMMGSAATSMSTLINKTINIAPPQVEIVNIAEEGVKFLDPSLNIIVLVTFNMQIEGLIDSKLIQISPLAFAKEMAISLIGNIGSTPPGDSKVQHQDEYQPSQQENVQNNESYFKEDYYEAPNENRGNNPRNINISPAEFQQLDYNISVSGSQNLDLILDVALNVSVELGRTQKTVKEILDFSTGSIIELNKLAGEAVDLMINGKLFAKGEVVVIDENFGVRILDIVSPIERVKKLQ